MGLHPQFKKRCWGPAQWGQLVAVLATASGRGQHGASHGGRQLTGRVGASWGSPREGWAPLAGMTFLWSSHSRGWVSTLQAGNQIGSKPPRWLAWGGDSHYSKSPDTMVLIQPLTVRTQRPSGPDSRAHCQRPLSGGEFYPESQALLRSQLASTAREQGSS